MKEGEWRSEKVSNHSKPFIEGRVVRVTGASAHPLGSTKGWSTAEMESCQSKLDLANNEAL